MLEHVADLSFEFSAESVVVGSARNILAGICFIGSAGQEIQQNRKGVWLLQQVDYCDHTRVICVKNGIAAWLYSFRYCLSWTSSLELEYKGNSKHYRNDTSIKNMVAKTLKTRPNPQNDAPLKTTPFCTPLFFADRSCRQPAKA